MPFIPVVAIDGPVGVGKSTIAREVARRLGYAYLDTGAMYRAVSLKCSRKNLEPIAGNDLDRLLAHTTIRFSYEEDGPHIFLDDEDVSLEIRRPEIAMLTSKFASIKNVRTFLVRQQQEIGKSNPCVVEGRDIGTVVFPDAFAKIFLDASVEERVARRHKQNQEKGIAISEEELTRNVTQRDEEDRNRPFGALIQAEDAYYLDSSNLDAEGVVNAIVKYCGERNE